MKKVFIDLAKLSEEIGCTFNDVEVAPGVVIHQTHWTKENYFNAENTIKKYIENNPAASVSIYGSPDPWNTVALVRELGITYTYPKPDHPEMIELNLSPLSVGIDGYNYDVQYEISEENDCIFINMTSDNPDLPRGKGTPHTFDLKNITKVHVPEISSGKDVYLHAWGMYSVMCAVASTFAETSRSVFIASHDTDYFCCATNSSLHEIGDQVHRSSENHLPHC